MRPLRSILLSLIIAACTCNAAGLLPEDNFPALRELLDQFEANSPVLRNEAGRIEEGRAGLEAANRIRRPRVNSFYRIQGQYETRFNSEADNINNFDFGPFASVNLSLPLFLWGEVEARKDAAEGRIESATAWTAHRAMQLRQELRRNFVEYQLAMYAAAVAEEGMEYARRKEEAIRAMLDKGQTARQNLYEAQLFAQERQEEYDDAMARAGNCLDNMREICAMPRLMPGVAPFPGLGPLPVELLERICSEAVSSPSGEELSLRGELETEQAFWRELQARNKPKIEAVASTNLDYVDEYRVGGNYENVTRVYSWLGIQANWTIYDSGMVKTEQRASTARQRRLEARMDEARLRRAKEASSIAREARLNMSRMQTRATRLDMLEASVKLMEAQLADNLIPANDLFQRKLDLERTRLELVRAEAAYMLAIAALEEMAKPLLEK